MKKFLYTVSILDIFEFFNKIFFICMWIYCTIKFAFMTDVKFFIPAAAIVYFIMGHYYARFLAFLFKKIMRNKDITSPIADSVLTDDDKLS